MLVDVKCDKDAPNVVYAYNIEIKNVSILDIRSYELCDNKERVAPMCTLQIPYNTEIKVYEVKGSN